MRYIIFNKPFGMLSQFTDEGTGHATLKQYVDIPDVYAAGRLDRDSEGLLFLTDDGSLIKQLTDPKHHIEKEYKVLLARRPHKDQLETWQRGVVLEDGYKTAPADVRFENAQGKGAWLRVVMREGRKRQIREMCKQLGLPIVRIVRIRIGTLKLGNLRPRQWRYLTTKEIEDLKQTMKVR